MSTQTIDHGARGHHPFSPSSLNTRMASPCWITSGGTNEAAERGTLQHEAVQTGEDNNELDDHEAGAVAAAIQMVANHLAELQSEGFEVHVLSEQYLPIDSEKMVDEHGQAWVGTTGGFADSVILWKNDKGNWWAHIRDWKFGKYAVTSAKHNLQGFAYVLGAEHWLKEHTGGRLSAATVTFFSPHREEEGDSINEYTFPGDFIRGEMRLAVRSAVLKARTTQLSIAAHPDRLQYYTPTLAACTFCGRLGTCPAVGQLMLDVVKRYEPLQAPEELQGWNITDPAKLSQAFKVADLAKRWGESFRKTHTDRCLEHPELVPDGYKLIASTPTKVIDRKALMVYLTDRFGADKVAENTDVALTPFFKLVRQEAERGTKDAAEEEFRETLQANGITRPSDVPVLSLRMK
jgi:Protein of unknown function (DUF2800)